MVNLDKKDRVILYELDRDARQPLSKISKKAKLSREAVLYRLRGYLRNGIIRRYLTVVDMAKLGFGHHKVFLKLHDISEKQEEGLIADLCKNPYITWVSSCDGQYSLLFAVKARSLIELDSILKEIGKKYWRTFMIRDIASIVRAYHYYRDYLVDAEGTTSREIKWGDTAAAGIKFDETDVSILDAICEDSRANSVEIAKKAGVSPDSVLMRIRRMEKTGLIEHYMIWPNVNRLVGLYYKVLIRLHDLDSRREKRLFSFCLRHPNIVYSVHAFGPWQFEIDVEARDLEEFRSIMRGFMNEFADIVSDYTPLNIYQEHKYRFFEKECMRRRNGRADTQ